MSRIANSPINLPSGVDVKLNGREVTVKGAKGTLTLVIDNVVDVKQEDKTLHFSPNNGGQKAMALTGTTRSLVNNMVLGVTRGFEKKLVLNGVGYRAKASGKVLNLTLGFSHPIDYELPDGVKADTPSQTEIVLSSMDKQLLGQVAAEIREFRRPEPYKGKGVSYSDEHVRRKDAKKK